jgi:hypothetical protein
MMKRMFMLLSLALMVGAAVALSGVAQAASPTAKCLQAAGLASSGSGYKVILGNKKNDDFTIKDTAGSKDVFCGLGGNDSIDKLEDVDIFIGGDGLDTVTNHGTGNYGTFDGGAGVDKVLGDNFGTFTGGAGSDSVGVSNFGTFTGGADNDSVTYTNYGTFYGEAGDDSVTTNSRNFNGSGTFYGGDGNDSVTTNGLNGTFYGEAGDDSVTTNYNSFFDGGAGADHVDTNEGTFTGGADNDSVTTNNRTFYGGDGNDSATTNNFTFNGEAGDDSVNDNYGTFDGGDGNDSVLYNESIGILVNVETCSDGTCSII